MNSDENQGPRKAVALKYDGSNAPRVTATGLDELADQIIEIARAHNIPLHEDPGLAFLLSQLELGDEIPEQLYFVIAEVIAFAYIVSGKAAEHAATRKAT
ncbi:MAG: flagellar biosynthesis protein [Gammaproteobacteria bacterium]|nr:MAG: flagellar biosynthesis protein [Gammaproteobacteria bacterium]TND06756.1 MAG: flagellar biosynthesis protein [Gammaproteobacteria bacterium]